MNTAIHGSGGGIYSYSSKLHFNETFVCKNNYAWQGGCLVILIILNAEVWLIFDRDSFIINNIA